VQKKLVTLEEYAEGPEDQDGRQEELVRGVVMCVRDDAPHFAHTATMRRVYRLLDAYVNAHRLGLVWVEGGFILERGPDTVRIPDIWFVRHDRVDMHAHPYPSGAPDLSIEILSPSNRRKQVAERVADLLRTGSRLVWCINPKKRMVTIYRPDGATQVLIETDTLSGEDVVPGFSCLVSELFDRVVYYDS
jgi:Uma2 family endonuclease